MVSTIIIDYREHLLHDIYPLAHKENLLVGDIIIKYQDYEIILERKTIADLLSSIKDGRYKEQKIRLITYMKEKKSYRIIAYILEGDPYLTNNLYTDNDKNIVLGFIVSNNIREHIPIFHSKDHHTTKLIIDKLSLRLMTNHIDFFPLVNIVDQHESKNIEVNYISTIKMKKKDNINPSSWYCLCLAQIPGVSHTIAEMIIKSYPTLESLYIQYQNTNLSEQSKELLLSDIKISNTEISRKIGKNVSTRIYNFINTNISNSDYQQKLL